MKKGVFIGTIKLVIVILAFFIVLCIVPILHDLLVDMVNIGSYDYKNGVISDVYMKSEKHFGSDYVYEYVVVDGYDMMVDCNDNDDTVWSNGDNIDYYLYNDNAYFTKERMESSNIVVKILDYGMIFFYAMVAIITLIFNGKIYNFIHRICYK